MLGTITQVTEICCKIYQTNVMADHDMLLSMSQSVLYLGGQSVLRGPEIDADIRGSLTQ